MREVRTVQERGDANKAEKEKVKEDKGSRRETGEG